LNLERNGENMKRRRRSGFTLIEVLFAVFLVTISGAMVAATLPISTDARARADLNNKATGLIQKQLEAIRGLGYQNATPGQLAFYGLIDSTATVAPNTYTFTNSDSAALDNPSRILPGGTGTILVEQPDLDLRRITITVTWVDRGRTRTLTDGTLIANL
jgi:prepilin-type N-terminal cleavage/methylation domain-containing protein